MDPVMEDLLQLLQLEQIEDNIFRGESRDIGSAQVFGGQVLGQALSAANNTVHERQAHSLHAYFLRRGDMDAPIIYDVDRSRDGGSFSVRRVVAIQHGRPIFNLAASFQKPEEGLNHQIDMPDVVGPENLPDLTEVVPQILENIPEKMHRYLTTKRAFDFRPVDALDLLDPSPKKPQKCIWIKAVCELPIDTCLHQNLLAYVSDYGLLSTATLPHGFSLGQGRLMMASLDHALWFHRRVKIDDWLLYTMDSPNSSGARGFARGHFFDKDGCLIASTAQEGLVRLISKESANRERSDPKSQV